jgi:hypothetical protein
LLKIRHFDLKCGNNAATVAGNENIKSKGISQ